MSSEVWKYFKIDAGNDKFAKCNVCSKLVLRGGASKTTSNFLKHIEVHHSKFAKPIHKQKSLGTVQTKLQITSSKQTFTEGMPSSSKVSHNLDTAVTKSKICQDIESPINVDRSISELTEESLTLGLDQEELSVDIYKTNPNLSLNQYSSDESTFSSLIQSPNSVISSQSDPGSSPKLYPKPIKLTGRRQQTLTKCYDKLNKFKATDPRSKEIDRLVAEMICLDLQPLSIVENKGFLRLLNHLEPRYTIPTRRTFSNRILNEMYSEVSNKVMNEVHDAEHIAITTDMWTSIASNDYMAVTAHFYLKEVNNWQVMHRCIEVIPFTEVSHTADHLKHFLEEVLKGWGIYESVVAVVRDNGKDISAALQRSEFKAVSCVAHTLQLVIKDGLMENIKISNLIKKTKKIVGSFKHSSKNTKVLKLVQKQLGLPQHRMIQDEPTRWNSTLHMLRRIEEQKNALVLIAARNEVKLAAEMTTDDWKTLSFAVEILEIFDTATLQLSKSTSCISEVIPLVHTIHHYLETKDVEGSGLLGLKNDLISSVKRRYPAIESEDLFACSTLLDPRFKITPFKDQTSLTAVKGKIVQEMTLLPQPADELACESGETSQSTGSSSQIKRGFWSHYSNVFIQTTSPVVSLRSRCEAELNQYLQEPTMDPKLGGQVPTYWFSSPHKRLKQLATKYLCIPPSTVYSERLFSTAGNICDAKRNRLDPERVKMLVFLNKNL